MIVSEAGLIGVTGFKEFDAVVVEGYDGVGKGRVLKMLSEYYGVVPYRPDYNLWQRHDLRKADRWKISGFFWDIFSHFNMHLEQPMLFDRGCVSGAVYAKDETILRDYERLLRDMHVLHILVECSIEDYKKFQLSRNPNISPEELSKAVADYEEYRERYRDYLTKTRLDWVVYNNVYKEDIANKVSNTCEGCGHYSYGICRHPSKNHAVPGSQVRCELSYDEETQDREVAVSGSKM